MEAGLRGAVDESRLEFALREARVIVTQDEDFLRLATSGTHHAGMVYNMQGTKSIGQFIEFLELVHVCMSEEEMVDHVEFL